MPHGPMPPRAAPNNPSTLAALRAAIAPRPTPRPTLPKAKKQPSLPKVRPLRRTPAEKCSTHLTRRVAAPFRASATSDGAPPPRPRLRERPDAPEIEITTATARLQQPSCNSPTQTARLSFSKSQLPPHCSWRWRGAHWTMSSTRRIISAASEEDRRTCSFTWRGSGGGGRGKEVGAGCHGK